MPTYILNEAQTKQVTEQATQGVKRKAEYLPDEELTLANKKQKTQTNDVMSSSEFYAPSTIKEVVTEVKALLYQRYQEPNYAELKRLLHERHFSITESFINLAIVKEHEQKPKEDEQLKAVKTLSRDEYINSFETIYQPKVPIKIEELIFAQQGENIKPNRQLIEGRAGIGKTTLCQYLAHQWAAGDNKWEAWRQQFDWVIHLSLRQLTAEDHYDFSKLTLVNWVYKRHLTAVVQQSFTEAEFAEAWQALKAKGKVLLLLDGYDEIVPTLKTNPSLQSFFEQTLLSCEHFFIFSRPYYFTDNCVERRLENIGFTQEDIYQYVQHYFRDIEKEKHISQQTYADSLISYLKQNPNAKGIAHIPINLELLCYTWESGKNPSDNQLTLTQLYDHLVLSLFGRYLHKFYPKDIASPSGITWNDLQTDTEYNCQQMLAFLEQLAWHQMQESSLIISVDIIKRLVSDLYPSLKQKTRREIFGEEVLKQLGMLKGCDVHKPTLEQSYYFIHLTFQEYFAARHWSKLFQYKKTQEEAIQFLKVNKFNPRHEMVWKIVAGLLSVNKTDQSQYFDILLNEPKDLIGLNHLLLQIQCLEETYSKETSLDASEYKKVILNNLSKWIEFQILKKLYFGYHIANYLAFCPNLMCRDEIINLWGELLKNQDEAVKVYAVSCLAKSIQLPEKLLIKLLDLLEDIFKNGGSLNLIHHVEVVLLKQNILSKVVLERILLLKDWEIHFENLAKILSKSCSADNTFIIDKLEPLLTGIILRHVLFAAKVLAGVDNLREEMLLKLIDLLKIGEIDIIVTISNVLAKQIKLPESIIKLLDELYQNNPLYHNVYVKKIFLYQAEYRVNYFNQIEECLSKINFTKKIFDIDFLDDQENLPESVVNKLVESIKTIQILNKDVKIHTPIREQALKNSNENFGLAYSFENEYANFKFKAIRIILKQKSIPNTFFTYYLSLLKESKFPLDYIYFLEIKNNHTSLPDELLKYILMLLSEKIPIFEQGILRILSTQNRISDLILHQILTWLETNDKKLQSYALYILCFHKNILPKSFLKNIYTFLQDDNLHSDAAVVLSNQSLELNYEEIKELIKGLHDKEKRNSILQVLSSQTKFDQDVFSKLDSQLFSQGLLNDYLLAIKNVSLQSIAMILKSEWNLPNSLALIHALLLKSLQANIPIYLVKDNLYLGNNKISLNIEKTLVIEALTQVISIITGWELEFTPNVSKAEKTVYAAYENQASMNNNTNIQKDAALTNANTKNTLQTHPTTTTSVLTPKLPSLAQTNFFHSEKNIQLTVPKHYTVHINQQAVVFEVKTVAGDDDFGYTAFGISRTQAYQLLINYLNEIRPLIKPALQEALRTQAFIDRLRNKECLTNTLSIAYANYINASYEREMPQAVLDELDRAGDDLTILFAYIDYDVKDKQIDAGWSHPCILFALAEIQKIELHIWQNNAQNELIPHQYFSQHIPAKFTQRTDLLFVNGNHFERLEPVDDLKLTHEISNTNVFRPF